MRFFAALAFLWGSLCLVADIRAAETSQVPTVQITPEKASEPVADGEPDPRDNRKTPLTPEEELQQEIRMFDPLDKAAQQPQPLSSPRNSATPPGQPSYSTPGRSPNSPLGQPAQNTDDAVPYNSSPDSSADQPLPGSLAALEQQNQPPARGPRVAEDESSGSQPAEYTGPAVLTRAYAVNTLSIPTDLKWHESVSFTNTYDTSTAKADPESPTPPQGGVTGATVAWSFGGQHVMKSDQFGIAYSGSASLYSTFANYSGANHRMTLTYSHRFSRRLTLSAVNSASYLSANYPSQNPIPAPGASIADANTAVSPTLQPYATSMWQLNTQVSMMWQQSARLSYSFSGGYFNVSQSGPGLVGVYGLQAQGSVNYRYSNRTTVGLYYSYGHNQYPDNLGASDTSSAGLSYSVSLSRSMQISVRAGLSQTESITETPVQVPPIVALLTGSPFGLIDAYTKQQSTDISVRVMKDFGRNLTGSIAFVNGISPGNGIILTSNQQIISAGLSTKLFRRYTVQVSAVSQALTSVAQTASGSYRADLAQISIGRSYRGGLSVNASASYGYYGTTSAYIRPYEIHLSSGVSWSPPNLKIWPF
jgi:hypothetical protein